jgi:hypothetical protein
VQVVLLLHLGILFDEIQFLRNFPCRCEKGIWGSNVPECGKNDVVDPFSISEEFNIQSKKRGDVKRTHFVFAWTQPSVKKKGQFLLDPTKIS